MRHKVGQCEPAGGVRVQNAELRKRLCQPRLCSQAYFASEETEHVICRAAQARLPELCHQSRNVGIAVALIQHAQNIVKLAQPKRCWRVAAHKRVEKSEVMPRSQAELGGLAEDVGEQVPDVAGRLMGCHCGEQPLHHHHGCVAVSISPALAPARATFRAHAPA